MVLSQSQQGVLSSDANVRDALQRGRPRLCQMDSARISLFVSPQMLIILCLQILLLFGITCSMLTLTAQQSEDAANAH